MMQEVNRKKTFAIGLRTAVPYILRGGAGVLLAIVIGYAVVSYMKYKPQDKFQMKTGKPQLSSQVVSRVEGYEQRVSDGEKLTLVVRAAVDVTYSDGHHELENVEIESYSDNNQTPDKIKANRAVYMPGQEKLGEGEVTFTGSVFVQTNDNLLVRTESLDYEKKSEIVRTELPLSFQRENVSGQTIGAVVNLKDKHLEMKKDVLITVAPEKPDDPPFVIRSGYATFSDKNRTMHFKNSAIAEQGQDFMSGDSLFAVLNEKRKVQKVETTGNAYLRSMKENAATELRGSQMAFYFDKNQQLEKATVSQNVLVRSINTESETQVTGASWLEALFTLQNEKSVIKEVKTAGRTTVTMGAPQSKADDPRAVNKRLVADAVKLNWRVKGKDLETAEAVGNAELYIEPLQTAPQTDKKTLKASRFDCDFFETGNLAKTFVASNSATAVIEPTQPSSERQTRTISSDKMTAFFVRETQDAEKIDAQGNVKFNEQDRNGTSATAVYTANDETVRLRGGEPLVWDSSARVKASEIDWNTRNETANARGKVSTTYYSQEKTNGATPFEKKGSPVYVTSDRAEYNQITKVGVYTGNARAWQDDNFVRADRITLRTDNRVMVADGKVQSALYNAKKKEKGNMTVVPVFAIAERMTYSDNERTIRYETNVDIRQGTDRVTSGIADVFLQKQTNELEKTIAQNNVVMTQPNRRGTGDWAQYTMADETFVLKGSPAKVEDQENGTNEGGLITVYNRENKVVTEGGNGTQSGGRVKSTHIIKKP